MTDPCCPGQHRPTCDRYWGGRATADDQPARGYRRRFTRNRRRRAS